MKKPTRRDYRVRISEPHTVSRQTFCNTYIVRKGADVRYIASDEAPLALSNLILKNAAEVRFALEDALDGGEAADALRKALAVQWTNNKALMPLVTAI